MPALLEDPSTPIKFRTSGTQPYPVAGSPLPKDIVSRQLTLRDGTKATLLPYASPAQVPKQLLESLHATLNREIEAGDSYPMIEPMEYDFFAAYWFGNFAAVMVKGEYDSIEQVLELSQVSETSAQQQQQRPGAVALDWSDACLGSFYIKPNYPGRSSHVCNAGFLVTEAARGKGVGRLMGEVYLDWAPKLNYIYSVFNLVYATNVASCRIWDALGFQRIGRVPGCGNLKSHPDQYIDAIIYGRDLVSKKTT